MSIRSQVERIKELALAHAELERLCARLAQFEHDVMETERRFGQPFKRGRGIIERTRAQIRRERVALERAAHG
jgi:hypothetical protein